MYYTNYNEMREDEIFMAALMSENFCELYDIISNILSGAKLDRFMESVINMSKEWVPLHEWAKDAMDELVEESTREELRKEVRAEVAEEVKKEVEQEAKQVGAEENTIEIIKSMLNKNMSYEDISDITNKTIDEIKEIEKSMKEVE